MSETVALIMKCKVLAQSLMRLTREEKGIQMYFQPDYADADVVIRGCGASCALIEVAESGEYDVAYCLALCAWLKKETPACKLLLLCPEMTKNAFPKSLRQKSRKDRRFYLL